VNRERQLRFSTHTDRFTSPRANHDKFTSPKKRRLSMGATRESNKFTALVGIQKQNTIVLEADERQMALFLAKNASTSLEVAIHARLHGCELKNMLTKVGFYMCTNVTPRRHTSSAWTEVTALGASQCLGPQASHQHEA
jgi:hypothetical protein